jgi:hypothetical protein
MGSIGLWQHYPSALIRKDVPDNGGFGLIKGYIISKF